MGLYPPCAVEGAMKNTSRDRAIDRWADQLHPGGRDHRGESSSAAAATGCLDGRLKRPSPPRVPWARVEQGCDGSGRRTATATGSISWRSGPNQRGWGGAARGEEGVARSAAAARDPYPGRGQPVPRGGVDRVAQRSLHGGASTSRNGLGAPSGGRAGEDLLPAGDGGSEGGQHGELPEAERADRAPGVSLQSGSAGGAGVGASGRELEPVLWSSPAGPLARIMQEP